MTAGTMSEDWTLDDFYDHYAGIGGPEDNPFADDGLLADMIWRYRDPSYLYAVAANGRVKLGRSRSPESRIKAIQLTSPVELNTLAIIPESVVSEDEAHERWSDLRAHGEWFERTDELESWLERKGRGAENHPEIHRRLVELMRRRLNARRPLSHLRDAEASLQADRIRRQRKAALERERERGCALCEDSDSRLQKSSNAPGFYCSSCSSWLSQISKKGVAEKRRRYVERIEEAKGRLAKHDYRVARLERVLAEKAESDCW